MNICESSSKLSSELPESNESEPRQLERRVQTETTFQTLHFDQLERNDETIEINCGSIRSIASELTQSVVISDEKSEVCQEVPVGSSINEEKPQQTAGIDVWVTKDEMSQMLINRDNQLASLQAQIDTLAAKPVVHSSSSQTDMTWEACDSVEQRIEFNRRDIISLQESLREMTTIEQPVQEDQIALNNLQERLDKLVDEQKIDCTTSPLKLLKRIKCGVADINNYQLVGHIRDLESKVDKIEQLNYIDFEEVQKLERLIDDLDGKLTQNRLLTATLKKGLLSHNDDLGQLKAMESEIYTLKVCVGGILGRELGLGNGEIGDDQVEVSDASTPQLSCPRLGKSTWNPTSRQPWMRVHFRRPVIVKALQFYSPLSANHGSAFVVRHVSVKYRSNGTMVSYANGTDMIANTEPDRNEFLILPSPLTTDLIELFPRAGFGRRAVNFQMEILGNSINIGEPMGLSDGRVTNEQIYVSNALGDLQYPRLNRSTWDWQITHSNQIMSLRIVFPTRVILGGLRVITRRQHQNPVQVTHADIAYIDQRGQERTHYDQRPVGQQLRLCDAFDAPFDVAFNVRIKTKTIIIYPATSGIGRASLELELLGNYHQ